MGDPLWWGGSGGDTLVGTGVGANLMRIMEGRV